MMMCNGCGNKDAYRTKTICVDGQLLDSCDKCASLGISTIPDVYWPGSPHYNPNLVDKKSGQPVLLRTRAHKAEVMRQLGVIEAGDRVRGSNSVYRGRM